MIGAKTIVTSRKSVDIPGVRVIDGIDVTDNSCGSKLASALGDTKIDILINNAGYFYGPVEKLGCLNYEEEIKMIDICALGPLRISEGLFINNCFSTSAKVC
jgi:short-subunit dehydrogenase